MRKILVLLIPFLFFCSFLKAQEFGDYKEDSAYVFDDTFKVLKSQIFTTHKSQFGLTADDQMQLVEEQFIKVNPYDDINRGSMFSRYRQYYKGYEVEYRSMSTLSRCGIVLNAMGNAVPNLDIDVNNKMTKEDALEQALYFVNAPLGYTWDDPEYENYMVATTMNDSTGVVDSNATSYPEGKLVIAKLYGDEVEDIPANYALCWKFGISYFDTITIDTVFVDSATAYYNVHDTIVKELDVYVNAATGEIWGSANESMGVAGQVWTWFHGYRTDIQASTCWLCPGYVMWDKTRGIKTHKRNDITSDRRNETTPVRASNNSWVDSDEKEPASAHWAVARAWDYYKNVHGVHTQTTIQTNVIVHDWSRKDIGPYFQIPTKGGWKGHFQILVPWGYASSSYASLDVMGHEFTHGMIATSSQIGSGHSKVSEPAAVNEAFCDIMGLCIENNVDGYTDWTVLDDQMFGLFKRNFNDPFNDRHRATGNNSATTYADGSWFNNPPYSQGGVLRRWFNHLSQGEWDWTPAYSGVGFNMAEHISHITMRFMLHSGSDFRDVTSRTLNLAASDYGGYCSPVWKKMERAWYDVGLIENLAQCKIFGLRTGIVVRLSDLEEEIPVLMRVESNLSEEESGDITVTGYTWNLPVEWMGDLDNDDATYRLLATSSNASRKISVIVDYEENSIGKKDTLYGIIHFSSDCDSVSSGKPGYTTDINESVTIAATDINIYPNPANSHLNITLPADVRKAQMEITDITGRIVYSRYIQGGYNNVSLSSLIPGSYLIRIKNDKINVVKRVQISKP